MAKKNTFTYLLKLLYLKLIEYIYYFLKVNRKTFELDCKDSFKAIHDDWETNICKNHPYDSIINGMSMN